jgi:CheY-like chemotaxis protein
MNEFCLIVDDEPSVQSLLSIILTMAKVKCSTCSTVNAMLYFFSDRQPDLIFLDAALEGSDAVEALRRLGSIGYVGTVQLVSGRAPDILEELCQMGKEYGLKMRVPLQKPFSVSQIRQILRQEGFVSSASVDAPVEAIDAQPLQGSELRCRPLFDVHLRRPAYVEARVHATTGRNGHVSHAGGDVPGDAQDLVSTLNFCRQQMPSFDREISGVSLPASAVVPCLVSQLTRINIASFVGTDPPNVPSLTWLTVELTEDDVIKNFQAARQAMLQLRIQGANTRILGAGTLFLSLGDDRRLPVREVILTTNLMSHSEGSALKELGEMVSIVKAAGASAIAEATAAPFDLAWLAEAGFDLYVDAREARLSEPRAFARKWGSTSARADKSPGSAGRESSVDRRV